MPNQLLTTGLEIKSSAEMRSDVVEQLQDIYGADINVDQNSPDGQLINIVNQAAVDVTELLLAIYNSFSPDSASGRVLDQRVALNGITRRAGTYSRTYVTIVLDRALNLVGLDTNTTPTGEEFTVSDDDSNQFVLEASESFPAAGSYSRMFRAVDMGQVGITQNTITNQNTPTLGVTSVSNPLAPTAIGTNEETDDQLKIRRARCFALGSKSQLESIQAALLNIASVTDAYVTENATAATVNGIPAHGIWCIVEGGTDQEVAEAIYVKKPAGAPMVGAESYTVTRPAGNTLTILFDRAVDENLHIKFSILPKVSGQTFDSDLIKTQLVAALLYRINQQATVGDVHSAMAEIAPKGYLVNVAVSKDGSTWLDNVVPTTAKNKFVLDTTRITIS